MAYQPSYDTDDSAVPAAVRIFFKRRLFEGAGIVLFLLLIAASLSLASWSVDDPSLNHALDRTARNWLGYPGAVIADELMQFFGLGVLVLLAVRMQCMQCQQVRTMPQCTAPARRLPAAEMAPEAP